MNKPVDSFKDDFPHMAAALEAASKVTPGNELQEQAAADVIAFAFDQEVRRAFPAIDVTELAEQDSSAE